MWQGLQTITDCKGKHSRELPSETSLPDELNNFYARFEASNTVACMRASASLDACMIMLSVASVGNNTSATLILNTWAPQGCVLSPILYSLFTQDCMAKDDSITIIKFKGIKGCY